jgi:hypothetical protein
MSSQQNGRKSQLVPRRARSARARGLRTLQHQTLPRATLAAIEAEIWLRILVVEHARSAGTGGLPADLAWATKDQVHDEALSWFLSRRSPPATGEPRPARPDTAVPRVITRQDVTFWVDSKLLARARGVALRQGLRVAVLMEQALGEYVRVHVPVQVMRFYRRAQTQAQRLHARRSLPTVAPEKSSAILNTRSIGPTGKARR